MNTLIATLKQDLHALRWSLPLCYACWIGAAVYRPAATIDSTPSTWIPPLIAIGAALTWFIGVGRLAYNHPAADDCAAWRTRPLHRTGVGATKLGIGLLFFAAVPAGLAALALTSKTTAGFNALVFVFSLLLYLASLCRRSRDLLLTLGAIFALFSLGGMVLGRFPREATRIMIWIAEGLAGGGIWFLWGGFAGLTLLQYRRPHTLRHATFGLVWFLGVVAVGAGLASTRPRVDVLDATGVTLHVVPSGNDVAAGKLFAEVTLDGLDETQAWQMLYWKARPDFPQSHLDELAAGGLLQTPGLLDQLGFDIPHIENAHTFPLPITFTRLGPTPTPTTPLDQIRYEVHLAQVKLSPLLQGPLAAGSGHDGSRAVSASWQRQPQNPARLSLTVDRPARLELRTEMPYVLAVLHDPTGRRAALLPWQPGRAITTDHGRREHMELDLPAWVDEAAAPALHLYVVHHPGVMFVRPPSDR